MAVIRRISTGEEWHLYPGFAVGRSHGAPLHLSNPRVSAWHAELRWTGSRWEVRDMSSANGSYVDDKPLRKGGHQQILAGSRIAFGDPRDTFELLDDSPPEPVAHATSGRLVFGEDQVLALPDSDTPEMLVRSEGRESWHLEIKGEQVRKVENGEELECCGEKYRLNLPVRPQQTLRPEAQVMTVANVGLRVLTDAGGSFVSVTILHGGREHRLKPRAHGELLLQLAQAMQRDQRDPALQEHDHGWVEVEKAMERLGVSDLQLNLYVHRARLQVASAGVIDGNPRFIERRHNGSHRQLRLGVLRIDIVDS